MAKKSKQNGRRTRGEKPRYKAIGSVIRDFRLKLGLNQGEFAQKIGLERSYLSRIEEGQRRPSAKALKRISKVLDVPLEGLLETSGLLSRRSVASRKIRSVAATSAQDGRKTRGEKLRYKAIGSGIRDFRLKLGLHQGEFAQKIGLERSYLSRIEKGQRRPSAKAFKRISKVLGVPLEGLLESSGLLSRRSVASRKIRSVAATSAGVERFGGGPLGTTGWRWQLSHNLRIAAIPVFDEVPAGLAVPEIGEESDLRMLTLAEDEIVMDPGAFGLRVKGDSMIDAGILEGDVVIVSPAAKVKDGDYVIVDLGDQNISLKRIYFEGDCALLQAANPRFRPVKLKYPEEVEILGKVILLRRLLV